MVSNGSHRLFLRKTLTLNDMKPRFLLLAVLAALGLAVPIHAQEVYLKTEIGDTAGGSDWTPEDDPRETDWNHDNGSDQWEGELGIEGGMPGGVELFEEDVDFIRIQDARTEGGSGDNRKIMFTKTIFEEGDDPLDPEQGSEGVTIHARTRLASPTHGLALEDQLDGGPWPEEGDGNRVRFGGKGSFGFDTAIGNFGFALGLADGDEALINADGDPVNGLMLNGVDGGDADGNVLEIEGDLTEWQEFWIWIEPDDSQDPATFKATVFHNGIVDASEAAEFFITPGDQNVGGAPEPSLYFGHAATDQRGAFDLDFLYVLPGLVEPTGSVVSDPNCRVTSRSNLGQLPTVPATTDGSVKVTNGGETQMLTMEFALSGPDADHWTIAADAPTTVAPAGGEAQIGYTFNSKGETGAFSATLTITTNDPDTPECTVALQASVINTEGPGGHYTLDSATISTDDDGVVTVNDITGYGRHGTTTGGPTFDGASLIGDDGQSASIGGGSTIDIPDKGFGDLSTYSVVFWVNLTSLPDQLGSVFALLEGNLPAFSILADPAGNLNWFVPAIEDLEPVFTTTNGGLTAGTASQIALVSDTNGAEVSIYIDGQLATDAPMGGNEEVTLTDSGTFSFGAVDGAFVTTGLYDDIQIYNKALTPDEVTKLFNAPGSVLEPEGAGGGDLDDDGLTDAREGELGTDANNPDSDSDGLLDGAEVDEHGTDPLVADSDGDGREDGAEITAGFDPLDPNSPAPPTEGNLVDNLVAYWPMDDSSPADTSGTANQHDGEVMGTAEWQPDGGKFGGAIFFDGSDGFIEVAHHPDFVFAEEESWTASLWYKTDAEENDQGLITKGYHDDSRATTGYWQLQTRSGTFTLDSRCCDGGNPRARIDSDSGISHGDGEWHHFVVARDGALKEIRLYVDGQLTASDVSAPDTGLWAMGSNEDPLVIANHFNRFTAGTFDDIAIWKGYALTDADVAAIAEAGVGAALEGGGGEGIPGLLGYWRFDEGSGATAADAVGANDGTITAPENAWANDPDRGIVYQAGGGSIVDLGSAMPALTVDSGFTWSFWTNSDETSNNNIVFGNRYGPDGNDFAPREFIKFTPLKFEWHFDGGGQDIQNDDTPLPIGEWVHNLVVKDGATLTYYRNGAVIGTGEITGSPVNAQPLLIGGQIQNGAPVENFSGRIDEVAIFDRALTEADVADIYNRGLNGEALNAAGPAGPGRLPDFEDIGLAPSGAFGVVIPAGETWDIQYSTDLFNWTTIATGLDGAIEETEAARLAAPAGYYRGVRQ